MIKNKRNFFIAIIMTLLSFVAFIIYMKTNEYRYFITMLVGIFYAMIQYYQAFSTSIFEELKIYNDERDDFIIMKTSHLLLRIMNYILFIMVFFFNELCVIWYWHIADYIFNIDWNISLYIFRDTFYQYLFRKKKLKTQKYYFCV